MRNGRFLCDRRQKRTDSKRPRHCHKVPITLLSDEYENPSILRISADGAPDMKMMGAQIIGKFL